MNWIRTTDKMPNIGEFVLCATSTGYVDKGYYCGKWHDTITKEPFHVWYTATGQAFHLMSDKSCVVAWVRMPKYEGYKKEEAQK